MTPIGGYPAAEVGALGAEHAAEHANRPSPELLAEPDGGASVPNAFTGGSPSAVGRWTDEYFPLPNYAMHTVMLPTGKVLFWGYPPEPEAGGQRPNGGEAALWDPSLGSGPRSITEVDPPVIDLDGPGPLAPLQAPLYCSGQSVLPSGAVLAAGGNLVWPATSTDDSYDDYVGADIVYTFDPWAERWIAQARMDAGRWYPSQVRLSDGRTAILGGLTGEPPGGVYTDTTEVFDPGPRPGDAGTITPAGAGPEFVTALYPHLTSLPNGRVLLSGPAEGDYALLDFPAQGPASIQDLPGPPDKLNRVGGNAVPAGGNARGAWRVTQIGGVDPRFPANPGAPSSEFRFDAQATSVTTDGRSGVTEQGPALPSGRSFGNTVLLPDGSMVQVGGGDGQSPEEKNYSAIEEDKRVQVFDPATNVWTLGPNQREFRTYHSTAVLLPDGRVFSAGDDYHSTEEVPAANGNEGYFRSSRTDTAEIYKPAYLFGGGARPRIAHAPRKLGYREPFTVQMARGRAAKAVLMAPSATTHGADMGQARIPLRRKRAHGRPGLRFAAPPSAEVATPGPYMLFVLSRTGKPSVARWVMLG